MHLLNRLVVATLPAVPRPVVRYFAGRYIAGETLEEAVACVQQLNVEGVCATLDVLGEDILNEEDAAGMTALCKEALHAMAREHLDSNLSIKLTSLGLKLGKDLCIRHVREVLSAARELRTFVRFDMEDSTCTSDTIEIFRGLHREFPATGIVLQAYLHRTESDALTLLNEDPNFRLCKGIYKEKKEIAFQDRASVQRNYIKLLEVMLGRRAYVGIATHDSLLVDAALKLIAELSLGKDQYEFQMLLGVRPELRRRLVRDGHRVRLYVPYGSHWYNYSLRRFKENPEIAGYVFKALFKLNK
jgi:proline dehydrogenase